jgi:predicted TPR repeat methyltransferase
MPALYDRIGSSYARSRRADAAIAQTLADQLRLTPFGTYLDLGCGTGNYTVALGAMGGVWRGVDVSEVMLA